MLVQYFIFKKMTYWCGFSVLFLCFLVSLNVNPVTSQLLGQCEQVQTSATQPEVATCDVTQFNAIFAQLPPYMHQSEDDDVFDGVVVDVMRSVLGTCCGNTVHLCYANETSQLQFVEEDMTSQHHLAFPVFKTSLTTPGGELSGYTFLPILETAGLY